MIIKMNKDKSLQITKRDTIINGEHGVNNIIFYIPNYMEDIDLSDIKIDAILECPDHNEITKTLELKNSEYDDYLKYSMIVDETITDYSGTATIKLQISNEGKYLIKSKAVSFDIIQQDEHRCYKCNSNADHCGCNC